MKKQTILLFLLILIFFNKRVYSTAGQTRSVSKTSIFTEKINRLLPEPQTGLLNGIIFGEKAKMDKSLYNALIKTGTIHMIALSGMNITILINLIAQVTLVFGRRNSIVLSFIGLIGFIWIVGASASVVRASIMAAMGLIAVYFGRKDWSLLSLFAAGGIMLIMNFGWLFEISFQLSFLATLGIIMIGGNGDGGGFGDSLKKDLRTTLAAQIFTLPVVIYNFQQVSLVAPLTNVLIGWTIPFVMSLGLITALMAALYLPLSYPLVWILSPVLSFIVKIIEITAQIPFAQITF